MGKKEEEWDGKVVVMARAAERKAVEREEKEVAEDQHAAAPRSQSGVPRVCVGITGNMVVATFQVASFNMTRDPA